MTMTTIPPVMVVPSWMSSVSSVTVAPSLTGLPATLGQHEVVLPSPMMPRGSGGIIGSASVPQQATSIFDASSGLCQLCYGFSTGRFLFQSWASHHVVHYMFGFHSGVCFLLSGAKLDAIFTYGCSTIRVFTIATLWGLPMAGICATWWWSLVHAWYA